MGCKGRFEGRVSCTSGVLVPSFNTTGKSLLPGVLVSALELFPAAELEPLATGRFYPLLGLRFHGSVFFAPRLGGRCLGEGKVSGEAEILVILLP